MPTARTRCSWPPKPPRTSISVTTDSLFGLKVDLQHVEGYEGYPIIEELCAYNAKSHAKAYQASRPITPVVVVI
jgi:hypothetical protein